MLHSHCRFPLAVCKVVDEVGVRAAVGLTMLDFPTSYAKDFDDHLAKGLRMR